MCGVERVAAPPEVRNVIISNARLSHFYQSRLSSAHHESCPSPLSQVNSEPHPPIKFTVKFVAGVLPWWAEINSHGLTDLVTLLRDILQQRDRSPEEG